MTTVVQIFMLSGLLMLTLLTLLGAVLCCGMLLSRWGSRDYGLEKRDE